MWTHLLCHNSFALSFLRNIDFDTKKDEWDIYKHKIFKDGKIEIGFQSSSGKEGTSPLSEDNIREIHNSYHDQMIEWLKELIVI